LALQNRKGSDLSAEELRYIEHLYDAGIAWTDSQIGALFAALAERGRLDRAIVVVTADHGEEFQEHGKLLHTQVYDEHLRVPLLISFPEMRGEHGPACRPRPALPEATAGRTQALAQHVDLIATLTDCLGIDLPAGVQGHSLLPVFGGAASTRDAVYFDTPRGTQRGILRDGWKLIEAPASGRQRLYQLDGDPAERHDVSAREPERTRALAGELAAHGRENEAGRVEGENVAVPEEVHRALESLGYIREEPAP
jgi:arylsulfatase A-like enzyme